MVELPPLATSTRRGSAQSDLRLVTFKLGEAVYGIDVEDVHAIYHALPLIPDFNENSRIQGYLLLASRRMPVINLSRNGGFQPDKHLAEWVVALSYEDSQVGFIVDDVKEVLKLLPSALRNANTAEMEEHGFYLKAVAKNREQEIPIPDLTRFITEAIK
ncbi:chemotaxis protein CheW [bacterium]|nr:chemotaxis protein CheW [bacterium]MBU1638327.1 chemotaxis protein CheW [bacterium]MBU1921196.1 chemotaxis protein CheW [bacterium]